MPSKNSYAYYRRFLACLKRRYEKFSAIQMGAIETIFDDLIEKAPSAQMGGDDWCDQFFINSVRLICSGEWCGKERCQNHNYYKPYHCGKGCMPCKCADWKAWRKQWRSYPEEEACQKCRYFKPLEVEWPYEAQIKKANFHKCYCRAKELPDGCPKKKTGTKAVAVRKVKDAT